MYVILSKAKNRQAGLQNFSGRSRIKSHKILLCSHLLNTIQIKLIIKFNNQTSLFTR